MNLTAPLFVRKKSVTEINIPFTHTYWTCEPVVPKIEWHRFHDRAGQKTPYADLSQYILPSMHTISLKNSGSNGLLPTWRLVPFPLHAYRFHQSITLLDIASIDLNFSDVSLSLIISIVDSCAVVWSSTGGSASAVKVISSCSACLRELDPISAMSILRISAINLESPGCGRAARGSFVGSPM